MCNFYLTKGTLCLYDYITEGEEMYTKRNRFLMFLLMATPMYGIYSWYWICSVQNEICRNEKRLSGGLTLLLVIFTFGIYAIIWQFKTSGILKKQGAREKRIKMTICALFLIGIVFNPIIIQGQLNELADKGRLLRGLSLR